MQKFISELQRRKVLRVASGYAVGGWIVLQVALALQQSLNLPGWFSTLVVSTLMIGFPIALLASWFFEITPEGIKRTTVSGDGALLKPQTADVVLAGMLALVLIFGVAQLVMPRAGAPSAAATSAVFTPTLGDKSVAVLPFTNLSPDKENEYFADGLAEELLNLLAKIGDLKVISRTSSFAFKGKGTPIPEIAKQLGVRHILEGSVRSDGGDLRVTAQLIDVVTDTHLWSETYDRKIENVFALQEEISRDIAGALKVEVTLAGRDGQAPTKNIEAYRLYLKARALHVRRNEGDLETSVDLYKQALALDPNFAEAHAGLATNYASMSLSPGIRFEEFRSLARQSANAALQLDPNQARAISTMATLARQEFDWQAAVDNYGRAKSLDPADAVTVSSLAVVKSMIGEFEEATQLREEALRLDPIYGVNGAAARTLDAMAVRDDRKAERLAKAELKLPEQQRGVGLLALCVLARERGDHAELERLFRVAGIMFRTPTSFTETLLRAAKSPAAFADAAKAIDAEVARRPQTDPALLFYVIGDYERFFDTLEARAGKPGRGNIWMPFAWRAQSSDANANRRFKILVRKFGLVDYWKTHGWPDRCSPKGAEDFECH